MRVVVKIGGAELAQDAARTAFCMALRTALQAGHEIILVHGGGAQIRALTERLGLETLTREGLRVTDSATAEAALMVLGGSVNRRLVRSLEHAGVAAVGLTGADGSVYSAIPHKPDGVDLGWVGSIGSVQPKLIDHLLSGGYVPVLATVAPRAEVDAEPFFNINADMGAGPLCRALKCDALVFLTDVPGVLDKRGKLILELDREHCEHLEQSGVLQGGMLPKVRAALAAMQENPCAQIRIAPATGDNSVLAALEGQTGTAFVMLAAKTGASHG